MNRITERFARLAKEGRKGFIVYIGAGDPDLDKTCELAVAFDQAGVDVLELGVPFSDPLADGLVNQLAAQRGLDSGTTPLKVLDCAAKIRSQSSLPLVFYIYYNLVHRIGVQAFIERAAQAGVDGMLVLDLPPEEAQEYDRLMRQAGLCPIYLIAPTTPEERIKSIVQHASGFIYYISRAGVTGMQKNIATDLAQRIARIRAHTPLPIAVGFGISSADQARQVAACGDAVVVGSAVVDQIAQGSSDPGMVLKVAEFVKKLALAVKSV